MFSYFLFHVDSLRRGRKDYPDLKEGVIRLFLKNDNGETLIRYVKFRPYFYYYGELNPVFREMPQVSDIISVEKILNGKKKSIYKVILYDPNDIKNVRKIFEEAKGKAYEYDIDYVKRFMIDHDIKIFSKIKFEELDDNFIQIISLEPSHENPLNYLAFDIETYNPNGISNPKVDPIILLSYSLNGDTRVLSYKSSSLPYVDLVGDEGILLHKFFKILHSSDILLGYNSGAFDVPYIVERAKCNDVYPSFSMDGSLPKTHLNNRNIVDISLVGRVHVDVYNMVRFLAGIGAIKTNTYTLEEVYNEVFGTLKKDVKKRDIWKLWEDDELRDQLIKYSYSDSKSTYDLGLRFLPIFIEIARLVNLPLNVAINSTTGVLVEDFLLKEVYNRGIVAPNKPSGGEFLSRDNNPIEGAFVKMPDPGLYENIVVFDFRSLYPSIIVSHNISPETLTNERSSNCHISPMGHRFKRRPMGLIPSVLSKILEHRKKLKMQLKLLEKGSREYDYLYARQYAFKIIANSFYGMLRYVRARWYCRECAEATTAWERFYIKDVIKRAEEFGFKVLYSDTDSVFLVLDKKSKMDAINFMNAVNRELPDDMELELEDFYKRGIFVSKKRSEQGAKKKYALLSENGQLKIKGFELVRRDWSNIARNTQKKVIEYLLKEGDVDKAVDFVRKVIDDIKNKRLSNKELVIHNILRKNPSNYVSTSPELSAAQKGIKRGLKIREGYMIDYIITNRGKTISEKADLVEFVKEGDYDPEYYIDRQIIPAVSKLLGALGYDASALKTGTKQIDLNKWF